MTVPANKTTDPELKALIDQLRQSIADAAPKATIVALQKQVDALDLKIASKHGENFERPSTLLKNLQENEGISRLLKDKRGGCVIASEGRRRSRSSSTARPSSATPRPVRSDPTLGTRSALQPPASCRSIAFRELPRKLARS